MANFGDYKHLLDDSDDESMLCECNCINHHHPDIPTETSPSEPHSMWWLNTRRRCHKHTNIKAFSKRRRR